MESVQVFKVLLKQAIDSEYLPSVLLVKPVQGIRTAFSDIITAIIKPLIEPISGFDNQITEC